MGESGSRANWWHHQAFAIDDSLAGDGADRIKDDAILGGIDLAHRDRGGDGITWFDRGFEFQGLRQIDGAGSGQLVGQRCRDETG